MTDATTNTDTGNRSGIEIRNLYKIFGARPKDYVEKVQAGMGKEELNDKHKHVLGLQDINLTLPPGKISVIMGLSGSGKSTLIRHINGLIMPTAGEILYNGRDVVKMNEEELREFRRHETAMVFQKFALLPHRTVLENTCYGLDIQGVDRSKSEPIAKKWIERVGLAGYEDNYPNQLSGGMQQRVGLARALANDADILLMDEAFSALDPLIRMDMQKVLLDLQAELKKTIVFITHDLDEALRLGDKIAILRDGALNQVGTGQEIVLRPANEYIAEFVREVNRGRVIRAETIALPLPEGELPKMKVKASSVLEKIARRMADAEVRTATVVDAANKPIGMVDMTTILTAMVTPASVEEGDDEVEEDSAA
ncbi:proline/glycine betaine ABC transporter ATP-binding protein [Thioclava sediminum]|uniref:Quaternary amine transport ATP-binding protein n=2 Tax=Thioclava TaxID=285107 RepID=A0ABX6YQ14_9RHOB|nr:MULTISPECIES: glycine betaine/L-proline ABC transporter ATP-binding protein [Thioclava]OOY15165.1 proline/glycine betaine ABC transporter ATP-binding protein [Thioclava sp. DLFJ4-1]OOY25967.1 proline/glycine betaine ABC transporter ATP-binding protein [Thioclava sediminum]QPZ89901.1 glycine betaine/L-proline ABC transporter ATP-binding protein [Thioclava electrotropha]